MIPTDPVMLMSYLNTKLRDEYDSLERLCEDLDLSVKDLEDRLEQAGFSYDRTQNRIR